MARPIPKYKKERIKEFIAMLQSYDKSRLTQGRYATLNYTTNNGNVIRIYHHGIVSLLIITATGQNWWADELRCLHGVPINSYSFSRVREVIRSYYGLSMREMNELNEIWNNRDSNFAANSIDQAIESVTLKLNSLLLDIR